MNAILHLKSMFQCMSKSLVFKSRQFFCMEKQYKQVKKAVECLIREYTPGENLNDYCL
jgi:hypothetical protein